MGVAAQIAKHLPRSAEGGLGIHDPLFPAKAVQQSVELFGGAQHCGRPSLADLFAVVEAFDSVQEFVSEDTS
jgi:hypothetical protein